MSSGIFNYMQRNVWLLLSWAWFTVSKKLISIQHCRLSGSLLIITSSFNASGTPLFPTADSPFCRAPTLLYHLPNNSPQNIGSSLRTVFRHTTCHTWEFIIISSSASSSCGDSGPHPPTGVIGSLLLQTCTLNLPPHIFPELVWLFPQGYSNLVRKK